MDVADRKPIVLVNIVITRNSSSRQEVGMRGCKDKARRARYVGRGHRDQREKRSASWDQPEPDCS